MTIALDMPSAAPLDDIEHVVLRHRGDDDNETVIQPTAVDTAEARQFYNLIRCVVRGQRYHRRVRCGRRAGPGAGYTERKTKNGTKRGSRA